MAPGLGLASVRADKTSEEDSFGLVAFCLIDLLSLFGFRYVLFSFWGKRHVSSYPGFSFRYCHALRI